MRPAGRARRLLAARPPRPSRPRRDEEVDDDDWLYEQRYPPTIGDVSGVFEGARKVKPAQQIGFRPPQERNTDA